MNGFPPIERFEANQLAFDKITAEFYLPRHHKAQD